MKPDQPPVSDSFSSVPAAVDAIARGAVVVVVDAEDRENEGDFICAADKATPETVNFMLRGAANSAYPCCRTFANGSNYRRSSHPTRRR